MSVVHFVWGEEWGVEIKAVVLSRLGGTCGVVVLVLLLLLLLLLIIIVVVMVIAFNR